MACDCTKEISNLYPITIGDMEPGTEVFRPVIEQAIQCWQKIIRPSNKNAITLPDGRFTEGLIIDVLKPTTQISAWASMQSVDIRPNGWQTGRAILRLYDIYFGYLNGGDLDDVSSKNWQAMMGTMKHEIGHAFTVPRWDDFVGANNEWTGTNANNQYSSYGGVGGVPISTTVPRHWDRSSNMLGELLDDGAVANDLFSPISRVTIGAAADNGYAVNYSAADYFELKQPATGTGGFWQTPSRTIVERCVCRDNEEPTCIPLEGIIWDNFEQPPSNFGGVVLSTNCPGSTVTYDNSFLVDEFVVTHDPITMIPGNTCSFEYQANAAGTNLGTGTMEIQFVSCPDAPCSENCDPAPFIVAQNSTTGTGTCRLPISGNTPLDKVCILNDNGTGVTLNNNNPVVFTTTSTGNFTYMACNECGDCDTGVVTISANTNCTTCISYMFLPIPDVEICPGSSFTFDASEYIDVNAGNPSFINYSIGFGNATVNNSNVTINGTGTVRLVTTDSCSGKNQIFDISVTEKTDCSGCSDYNVTGNKCLDDLVSFTIQGQPSGSSFIAFNNPNSGISLTSSGVMTIPANTYTSAGQKQVPFSLNVGNTTTTCRVFLNYVDCSTQSCGEDLGDICIDQAMTPYQLSGGTSFSYVSGGTNGLTLSSAGIVTGSPVAGTTPGPASFFYTIDGDTANPCEATYNLTTCTTGSCGQNLGNLCIGQPITPIQLTGGTNFTFVSGGTLGLNMSSTGLVTGSPASSSLPGTASFFYTIDGAAEQCEASYTLVTCANCDVNLGQLCIGEAMTPFQITPGTNFNYVSGGTTGLTLSPTGVVSGTPAVGTATGAASFIFTVDGNTCEASYTLISCNDPICVNRTFPDLCAGQTFSLNLGMDSYTKVSGDGIVSGSTWTVTAKAAGLTNSVVFSSGSTQCTASFVSKDCTSQPTTSSIWHLAM